MILWKKVRGVLFLKSGEKANNGLNEKTRQSRRGGGWSVEQSGGNPMVGCLLVSWKT